MSKSCTYDYIAHRKENGESQTVAQHLLEVSDLTGQFSSKIGLGKLGRLMGLLHDLGKYSTEFQRYLRSAAGILDQDADEDYLDPQAHKGRIDHSTAGSQAVWEAFSHRGKIETIVGQTLALCIASHHSGLIDCVAPDGTDQFLRRMRKADLHSHRREAWSRVDKEVLDEYNSLTVDSELVLAFRRKLENICRIDRCEGIVRFKVGLLARFLFSCLIDADRINTADFERPLAARQRLAGRYEDWRVLADRLENRLAEFRCEGRVDILRRNVSDQCSLAAGSENGIFTLTVPTGGGKTLASLRFALRHAELRKMDRVIYVIPYTSIIDQNAEGARTILEPEGVCPGTVVLEHHSNLTPEEQTWRAKILSENWDAPVVFTTLVQFLETLFGAGTRGARRMHQLANAVIIFDEVQTLPVNCVHVFNNAINFLAEHCKSTILLCTATQPLLDEVDEQKGAVRLRSGSEIVRNTHSFFEQLNRVEVFDERKPGGWTFKEVAALALKEVSSVRNCLVIVNTKAAARSVYQLCQKAAPDLAIYHLSTNMCPAHRKACLSKLNEQLERRSSPVLCISTQLMEAGVDLDFGAVVRYTAGLDSIAQAAGRCNRHGRRPPGPVHIVNPSEDGSELIKDIRIGAHISERVLDEMKAEPEPSRKHVFSPDSMSRYYRYYFFERRGEMSYPVNAGRIGRDDNLLNMLSDNGMAVAATSRSFTTYLRQSFMTAAAAFHAIDAPTQGVVVPYGHGKDVIGEMSAAFDVNKQFRLLRRAQQFTVNVFPYVLKRLQERSAVHEVQEGTGILYLDSRYYDSTFGLSETPVSEMEMHNV